MIPTDPFADMDKAIQQLVKDMHSPIAFSYKCNATGHTFTGAIGNNFNQIYEWCVEHFGEPSKIHDSSDQWYVGRAREFTFYKQREAELFAVRWM
jgi:hypothetical protein